MKKRDIRNAPPSMLINELSKLFNDQMRQKTEAMGMAEGWRRMLFHLAHNDSLTQLELARRTHLSTPAVSVTLQKMEAEGLVARKADPNDQRAIRVQLTEAGREADRKVVGAIHETEEKMLERITEEEIAAIRPILEKMYHNLTDEEGEK
ncbi:MAG: MarR family transcriptional regulator [Clostridia bacterium]|nr:MarR family transcriptional regulator [Clostridia bacterium]